MSEITGIEMPINDIKPFVITNVLDQCENETTARLSIVGAPGCGKSDIVRQICKENGWGLSVKYLSNMSLEQITGIPCQVKEGEGAKWTKPEIFNFENLEYKPDNYKEGESISILFIDDFHLADRIIQKYLFQLLTYKSLNGYKLPKNTAIILAGNRNTDKALANAIPAPVMNRISVYEVTATSEDWLKNFAFVYNIRDDIASFIHTKGDIFLSQTPVESIPWASPRSWTFLSNQMNSYEKNIGPIKIDVLRKIASSLIGPDYAAEFIAYRELFAKFNFDELSKLSMDQIKTIFEKEAEENSSSVYAIINAVTSWMISKIKQYNFNVDKKEVVDIINFTYEIMTTILGMKVHGIQVKPLVIAGTNYIYKFQEAAIQNMTNIPSNFNSTKILDIFVQNLLKKRDIDWIFYEIISIIFKHDLDEDDKIEIERAKKNLQFN